MGAASSLFTFGGSLSLEGLVEPGGWSGAISSLVDTIGLGGTTLGNMLGSAVQFAAPGALAGAAHSAITGGDIGKGATRGALIGGGLGAASSAMGELGGGLVDQAAPMSPGGSARVPMSPSGGEAPALPGGTSLFGQATGIAGSAMPAVTAPTDGGFTDRLFAEGGWLERNAGWLGPTVAGLGEGIMGGIAAKDELAARERMANARRHNPGSVWSPVKTSRGMMHPSAVY